jgi:hypothetical protein
MGECCEAGQVCFGGDGACCTATTCEDLDAASDAHECGEAGDNNCGGPIDCGECGNYGDCDSDTNLCDCDDNYLVYGEEHECRHVCEGHLTANSCCHADNSDVAVYCNSSSSLALSICPSSAEGETCGWSIYPEPDRYACFGSKDPANIPDEHEPQLTCPPEVKIALITPTCVVDGYEPNDDFPGTLVTPQGLSTPAIDDAFECPGWGMPPKDFGDDDYFNLTVGEGESVTIKLVYTVSGSVSANFFNSSYTYLGATAPNSMPPNQEIWESLSAGTYYIIVSDNNDIGAPYDMYVDVQ